MLQESRGRLARSTREESSRIVSLFPVQAGAHPGALLSPAMGFVLSPVRRVGVYVVGAIGHLSGPNLCCRAT
jgi:hypothetical protein